MKVINNSLAFYLTDLYEGLLNQLEYRIIEDGTIDAIDTRFTKIAELIHALPRRA